MELDILRKCRTVCPFFVLADEIGNKYMYIFFTYENELNGLSWMFNYYLLNSTIDFSCLENINNSVDGHTNPIIADIFQ